METLALVLLCGVLLVSVIGSIWMLIAAARVSVLWLLAVFFIPGAFLVFAIRHWDVAKKPFLLTAGPAVLSVGAAILIPNLVLDRGEAGESAPMIEGLASAIEKSAPALREAVTPAQGAEFARGTTGDFAKRFLRGDPSASCPPDATLKGARPPKGFMLWCEQDGVKHEPQATWHRNGQPATAGVYRHGQREGVWLRFSAKGDLEASAAFRSDVQHGLMREYDPLGRVRHESTWANGAPAG